MANVFVPLNRFQSLITNLTGEEDEIYVAPNGVSSIMLSMVNFAASYTFKRFRLLTKKFNLF